MTMTCSHINKTLLEAGEDQLGARFAVWRCDDCGQSWLEITKTPDTLYECHGDCAGCHMPVEEREVKPWHSQWCPSCKSKSCDGCTLPHRELVPTRYEGGEGE